MDEYKTIDTKEETKDFLSVYEYIKIVKCVDKKFEELEQRIEDLNKRLNDFLGDIATISHSTDKEFINSQTKEINDKLFKDIRFKLGSFAIVKMRKMDEVG